MVLVVGTVLGCAADSLTLGEVLAFAFLVNLFIRPVQMATQILTERRTPSPAGAA